jgi:hypothetical protein
VAQETRLPGDEERRLLAVSEVCRAQEQAAADQQLHSPHGLQYPAYMRLVDAYQAMRIESKNKWLAVRAHRKKVREEEK